MNYLKKSIIVIILFLPAVLYGQEFKKYQIKHNDTPFMRIAADNGSVDLSFIDEDSSEMVFNAGDATVEDSAVRIFGQEYFSREGIIRTGEVVPYDEISRVELTAGGSNKLVITLYRKKTGKNPNLKIRSGNVIGAMDNIIIDQNDFIRGSVVSFWGDIEIRNGEVSGNVVSIFGNVSVNQGGVVRKNIVSIGGSIDLDKDATIYGMINSSGLNHKSGKHRWHRWYRTGRYFSPIGKFHYNRVDGAAPYLGIKFLDEDSVLPEIKVYGGYGFASEKPRYHIEAAKHLKYRGIGFTVGVEMYRRLASDDNWLITETENTIFALLATEDYKDYYDAEGGYIGIEVRPYRSLSVGAGFRDERVRLLEASRNLWSLFGGAKRFPKNYKGISREGGTEQMLYDAMNGTRMKTLLFTIEAGYTGLAYSNESFSKIFSEWEVAPSSWNKEGTYAGMEYYDYGRIRGEAARYQKLTRGTGLLARGLFGFSRGVLPLSRQFYLGGLTTLKGYGEKEYSGTDFWMLDLDYRIKFSRFNFTGWLFYNAGEITPASQSLEDQELKQSIGAGITVFDFIRFDVAWRLDRSDVSPVIYGRLDRWF